MTKNEKKLQIYRNVYKKFFESETVRGLCIFLGDELGGFYSCDEELLQEISDKIWLFSRDDSFLYPSFPTELFTPPAVHKEIRLTILAFCIAFIEDDIMKSKKRRRSGNRN